MSQVRILPGPLPGSNLPYAAEAGKTKAEVRAKLRKLLADRDEGIAYDSENLTVGDYLDRWLGAVKGSVRYAERPESHEERF